MIGSHAIKHWSSTQSSVALSSGEAEFAGVIRGAGQGLGYQALLRDFGVSTSLRVWTDSSAAIGICNRQGLGKLRHLDTHTLWIQQAVRLGRVDLRKVAGEVNPADLFTKHSLSRQRLEQLVELHGCRYIGGRASTAPLAKTGASNKATMASDGRIVGAVVTDGEDPIMPHLDLSPSELDRLYPPIPAPVDERLDDMVDDMNDSTLQTGIKIADEIRTAMVTQGRTRRRELDDQEEKARPASLGFMTGAGVRQSPGLHQVSSTPIVQGRARHTLPPSDGGLPTCTTSCRPATCVSTHAQGRLQKEMAAHRLTTSQQTSAISTRSRGLLLGQREQVDGLLLGPREQVESEYVPLLHGGVANIDVLHGTYSREPAAAAPIRRSPGRRPGYGAARPGAYCALLQRCCTLATLDIPQPKTPGMRYEAALIGLSNV
jgi:hypothetical protein